MREVIVEDLDFIDSDGGWNSITKIYVDGEELDDLPLNPQDHLYETINVIFEALNIDVKVTYSDKCEIDPY